MASLDASFNSNNQYLPTLILYTLPKEAKFKSLIPPRLEGENFLKSTLE